MIRKFAHIVTAFLLAASLLLGGSAKEFIHIWGHHEDTIHDVRHQCKPGEAHFESAHHHCEFLGFVLAPFDGCFFRPKIVSVPGQEMSNVYYAYESVFLPRRIAHEPTRGPPALG